MKILRIYTKLPPLSGGMEKHIRYLTEYQSGKGHEVSVFFNQGEKVGFYDVRILNSIPLHRIRPQFLGILIFYMAIICYLLVHKRRFDILHIHGDWSSLVLAGLVKKITRSKKIAFSFHGSLASYGNLKKYLLLKTTARTNLVFCTGFNSFDLLKKHPGAIFQPSGVEKVFFDKRPTKKYEKTTIITVSRLSKVKNLETVLQIAKSMPQLDFILIGEGDQRIRLEKMIALEDIKNIRMTGQLHKDEIAEQLNEANIFLLTSFEEGTPTAAIEAMAAGLPLVVSNAGGFSAIIQNEKNGYIIQQATDVKAYKDSIEILLNSSKLMEEIALTNKILAEQFSWPVVGERITQKMINA